MCSFMIAPMWGICEGCDLEFFSGKIVIGKSAYK
nr:MAG TPA: hypothetical protein [Caudoviricetes sp.]